MVARRRPLVILSCGALALLGPQAADRSAAQVVPAESAKPPLSAAQWREDLDFLTRKIEQIHPNPFYRRSRQGFLADAEKLRKSIPELPPDRIIIEMMRLVASLRDGHTSLSPDGAHGFGSCFAVRFYQFTDGLFITAIDRRHAELAGAEVRKIGKLDAARALELASSARSSDNDVGRTGEVFLLSSPPAMVALGIIESPDALPLNVRLPDGQERSINLYRTDAPGDSDWETRGEMFGPASETIDYVTAFGGRSPHDYDDGDSRHPLHLRCRKAYWFEYLTESKTLYMQFNSVLQRRDERFEAFNDRLWKFVDDNDVQRFILDVRYNSGGNGKMLLPFVHGFIRHDSINQQGRLFTLVGRKTFSAAVILLHHMAQHTNTLFVGEPAGAPYNFSADSTGVTLPHSGLRAYISTLFWQFGRSDDLRQIVPVDIPAQFRSSDYFSGRDPAVEAACADPPWVSITEALGTNGGDQAGQLYSARQARFGHLDWWVPFEEGEMNEVGYSLLAQHRVADAIAAFELNTQEYAESWNTWDSLGEAYLRAQRLRNARDAYTRALQLDPDNRNNQNQIRILSRLNRVGNR